jgi:hypothetical protein
MLEEPVNATHKKNFIPYLFNTQMHIYSDSFSSTLQYFHTSILISMEYFSTLIKIIDFFLALKSLKTKEKFFFFFS